MLCSASGRVPPSCVAEPPFFESPGGRSSVCFFPALPFFGVLVPVLFKEPGIGNTGILSLTGYYTSKQHFYSEYRRVRQGVTAWETGNLKLFQLSN